MPDHHRFPASAPTGSIPPGHWAAAASARTAAAATSGASPRGAMGAARGRAKRPKSVLTSWLALCQQPRDDIRPGDSALLLVFRRVGGGREVAHLESPAFQFAGADDDGPACPAVVGGF